MPPFEVRLARRATARLCRPEVGVPVPARHRASWGYAETGAMPLCRGSSRPPRYRAAVPTGGRRSRACASSCLLGDTPRREPCRCVRSVSPAALPRGCADQRSAFPCLRVIVPLGDTPRREPCRYLRFVSPAALPRGGADQRSAFPCLRVIVPLGDTPRREPCRCVRFVTRPPRYRAAVPTRGQRSAFPCLRVIVPLGDTPRREPCRYVRFVSPAALPRGCAGPHRENWPEVGVPVPARHRASWGYAETGAMPLCEVRLARRATARLCQTGRTGQRSAFPCLRVIVPLGDTPRREPCRYLRFVSPAALPRGCADQRSAFPCLRVIVPLGDTPRPEAMPLCEVPLARRATARRCRPPPGELARGRRSLACASLRPVAWAPRRAPSRLSIR